MYAAEIEVKVGDEGGMVQGRARTSRPVLYAEAGVDAAVEVSHVI